MADNQIDAEYSYQSCTNLAWDSLLEIQCDEREMTWQPKARWDLLTPE